MDTLWVRGLPGYWSVIWEDSLGKEHVRKESDLWGSGQLMVLTAAIAGLEMTTGAVLVLSDQTYLVDGMNDWLERWRGRDWITAAGEPVKYRREWEELARLAEVRDVEWRYSHEVRDRAPFQPQAKGARQRRGYKRYRAGLRRVFGS